MKKIFLLSLAMLAAIAAQDAAAFQMDTGSGSQDGAARFSDPDDNLPVPHLDDNGTVQPAQPQAQQGNGSTGMSFGLAPMDNAGNGFPYGHPSGR